MREQQLIGLVLMASILVIALLWAAWMRHRAERNTEQRIHQHEPVPGSFTAAVLNAEGAANGYRAAVLTGNADTIDKALQAATRTGTLLLMALHARELEAKAREQARYGQDIRAETYASAEPRVSVTESDRLAGEPTQHGRRSAARWQQQPGTGPTPLE